MQTHSEQTCDTMPRHLTDMTKVENNVWQKKINIEDARYFNKWFHVITPFLTCFLSAVALSRQFDLSSTSNQCQSTIEISKKASRILASWFVRRNTTCQRGPRYNIKFQHIKCSNVIITVLRNKRSSSFHLYGISWQWRKYTSKLKALN